MHVHCGLQYNIEKRKTIITAVQQSEVDDSLDFCSIHEAVIIDVKEVKDGSDEVHVVMETCVPGAGEGLSLDFEAGCHVQQVLSAHVGQQVSQTAHCNDQLLSYLFIDRFIEGL